MATLRELKTRIGSVASSEKITGAMKMISSAKVHKNEAQLRELLPFKTQIQRIMSHILETGNEFDSALIETREVKRVGVVVFGSDDGLCGAYNLNIFKQLLVVLAEMRRKHGDGVQFVVYPVGGKIEKAVRKIVDQDVTVECRPGVDSKMSGEKVTEFTESLRESFLNGELDEVDVIYMRYYTMSRQRLQQEQLFPVVPDDLEGEVSGAETNKLYIFEPDPNSIFKAVLPMFVMSTMQEITIENRASEQAARVMAMQSANDNAKKLLEELQLEYNKLRQENITTELLDIMGGQVDR